MGLRIQRLPAAFIGALRLNRLDTENNGDRKRRLSGKQVMSRGRAYADFFFGFGLVAFGAGCGSGLPSIEDKRPAVNV